MLEKVSFGHTVSYSELAEMAGRPLAHRAVASANRRNDIPIFIPCHRVVGKGGSLTGFSACGGLVYPSFPLMHEKELKKKLIELEMTSAEIKNL